MAALYDLLSIGDATLDVFLQIGESDVRCNLKEQECVICFSYADKIPVDSIKKIAGTGNASNNAIGSARLGMRTAIYSVLGNDDTGKEIQRRWRGEGISTKCVAFDRLRPTNYSTVLNFRGERTILVYHEKRDYAFPDDAPKAKIVYLTSMGQGSERIHPQLIAYLDRTGAELVFQPGTFQVRLGMRMLKQLIARSRILIVNKEEALRLTGDGAMDIPMLLKEFHAIGCGTPVITDGQAGSYAFDGKDMLHMPIYDLPVVERTGAGDAYATAFVAAMHYGKPLGEAMRWGTANSASVIGAIGPHDGLLTRPKLSSLLRRFKHVKTERV